MINTPNKFSQRQMINGCFQKKSSGISILMIAITLLLVSTLLIFFTSMYSALQQKMSSNLYRNQQAFEAAQAGIEAAIPYFQGNSSAIIASASGGYLTAYVNTSTSNVALANGSKYTFVYTNPTASNYNLITITSTGVNADGTATRILKQQIQNYSTSTFVTPTVTISTQGNVMLSNNAAINNSSTNLNIHSGSFVSFTNSSHTTTSSGVSSNSSTTGSDLQQNDSSLASMSVNNYFQSIFGTTQANVQSAANYTYTHSSNFNYSTALNGVTGSVIWINQTGGTASITNNAVIGSAAKPVILIINGGSLSMDNSVTIYGFVFILDPTHDTILNNSATINGAIASTNDINLSNVATINYNSSVLNALPSVSSSSSNSYAKVPGSWRDF